MTFTVLTLLFLAILATVALGYCFFAGKYNTLITLRKQALQAWIDVTAADLRFANELRNQGFTTKANQLEEAAHYAVAVFGQPSAPEKLSAARAAALMHEPDHRDYLGLDRVYKEKVNFYNATLCDPFCAFLAKCCHLRRLPR
jgi:hypothetical protein